MKKFIATLLIIAASAGIEIKAQAQSLIMTVQIGEYSKMKDSLPPPEIIQYTLPLVNTELDEDGYYTMLPSVEIPDTMTRAYYDRVHFNKISFFDPCGCQPNYDYKIDVPDVFYRDSLNIPAPIVDPFEVNAYPNPSSGIINLDIANTNTVTIQLSDLNGKVLQNFTTQQRALLDLTEHVAGIYIIQVIDNTSSKVAIKKVIKVD